MLANGIAELLPNLFFNHYFGVYCVMERADRSLFVAFEGIDGAGKTTQVDMLTSFLTQLGVQVVRSKEPTDGPWGQKIRISAMNDRMSLNDELNAFIMDREEHCKSLIRPALKAGKTVILDRYFYSTIAYQGSRGGDVQEITNKMIERFPIPNVVFLIDVPAEIGISRISTGRGEQPNSFERICSLRGARTVFIEMAKTHNNIQLIDGTKPINEVQRLVLKRLVENELFNRYCSKENGCKKATHCAESHSSSCHWHQMSQKANEICELNNKCIEA